LPALHTGWKGISETRNNPHVDENPFGVPGTRGIAISKIILNKKHVTVMKNSSFSICGTSCTKATVLRFLLLTTGLFFSAQCSLIYAQANLSIQGILKKSNGEAVVDNTYNLTFKLYTQPIGGTAVWTEIQSDVEVTSGIYSTILGNIESLDISFNQLYYLGVTVGSTEMTPRIQLTSAPYALSIIGETNQFPSSGMVLADSLKVNGAILAKGGAPGLNGVNRNGYAFTGNSGDKDSGLFSTSDGEVSLYVNNVELLEVKPGVATLAGDLALITNGNVRYNGLDDWRLVSVENFLDNSPNGWGKYNKSGSEWIGWSNPTSAGDPNFSGSTSDFAGRFIYPTDADQVLKKNYNLSGVGPFNHIKVKFRYYFLDTWDGEAAFAAFATSASGTQMRVGWFDGPNYWFGYYAKLNTTLFLETNNFYTGWPVTTSSDYWKNAEMTAFANGTSFWLFFGAMLDTPGANEENYGVGMIEIWVK